MGSNWDERYRIFPGEQAPALLLTDFADLLPRSGRALDIACGNGRNSIWLARRGFEVIAIDLSGEALRQGRESAVLNGPRVTWLEADVESYRLESDSFDAITCFNFRSPALYPRIQAALRRGGWLFYETYTLDQLAFATGPRNPAHLLRPGELLAAFSDMRVIYYRETRQVRGAASIVARKEQ